MLRRLFAIALILNVTVYAPCWAAPPISASIPVAFDAGAALSDATPTQAMADTWAALGLEGEGTIELQNGTFQAVGEDDVVQLVGFAEVDSSLLIASETIADEELAVTCETALVAITLESVTGQSASVFGAMVTNSASTGDVTADLSQLLPYALGSRGEVQAMLRWCNAGETSASGLVPVGSRVLCTIPIYTPGLSCAEAMCRAQCHSARTAAIAACWAQFRAGLQAQLVLLGAAILACGGGCLVGSLGGPASPVAIQACLRLCFKVAAALLGLSIGDDIKDLVTCRFLVANNFSDCLRACDE